MTLRRKMALQITAMIVGLLLISGASLWGLNGLEQNYGAAVEGYQDLRQMFEVGSNLATAQTLLASPHPDADQAIAAVQRGLIKFETSTWSDPISADEPEARE